MAMTGDDSLALDSITSDYRFMLEHDVSMLEIALCRFIRSVVAVVNGYRAHRG